MRREPIDSAISEVRHAVTRMRRAAKAIPADKVNWSPSESARTPVEIVFHSAMAFQWIGGLLNGSPYPTPTTEVADMEFRNWESEHKDIGAAIELLKEKSNAYLQILEEAEQRDGAEMLELPFGNGQAPLEFMLPIAARHTNDHSAQLDYIQTILGDRRW